MPGPLDGVRVVDLATMRGALAGRVLADLGAEVIVIEPPGGHPGRSRPPFDETAAGAGRLALLGGGRPRQAQRRR